MSKDENADHKGQQKIKEIVFHEYVRTNIAEMRPYEKGEDMEGISVSEEDEKKGSPKKGDMIARNPANHKDQWLVAKKYFQDNFAELSKDEEGKTLDNTTAEQAKDKVADIKFWGDGDTFKLISKASSEKEKWMKSTKAMAVAKLGCVVQVTTQQGDNVSEAVVFVPGASIIETKDAEGNVIKRELGSVAGNVSGTIVNK